MQQVQHHQKYKLINNRNYVHAQKQINPLPLYSIWKPQVTCILGGMWRGNLNRGKFSRWESELRSVSDWIWKASVWKVLADWY